MRGQTYVIVTIILIIFIAIFAVMNVDTVRVNYIFWTVESPLILVILFSVLMGGVVSATVGAFKMIRLQKENKLLIAENEQYKKVLQEHDLLKDNRSDSS